MPLIPPPARRVVWEDGMHLTPQHFQAQRRYHEAQVTRTLGLLAPFAHGVSAVLLDEDAIRNGSVVLREAHGVLPDGTVFHVPDADAAPAPLPLATRFSPTRDAHVIHLALPPWRPDAGNLQDEGNGLPADLTTRFVVREEVLADEATGGDPTVVRFAARNLQLVLDDAITDDLLTLPLARVRRDGRGHFLLDPTFIPPVLQLGASDRLLTLVRELVALRRSTPALSARSSTRLVHAGYPLAYVRSGTHLVVVNPRREPTVLDVPEARGAALVHGRGVVVGEGGVRLDGFGHAVLAIAT